MHTLSEEALTYLVAYLKKSTQFENPKQNTFLKTPKKCDTSRNMTYDIYLLPAQTIH